MMKIVVMMTIQAVRIDKMRVLILVTLLFSVSAMAEMPKFLEGATVTVKLKNGKTHVYKAEDMAVVKRSNLSINSGAMQQASNIVQKVKDKELVENNRNRVYVLLGSGLNGDLNSKTNGSKYKISHDKGTVLGFGYQYKFTNDYNLGMQVQDNGTTSLSIGMDF